MPRLAAILALAALAAMPVRAESHLSQDAAIGEAAFAACRNCHVIRDDAGNLIAGTARGKVPNLYGVIGRAAGSAEGYRYGSSLRAAGEAGLIWDEETLAEYLLDPQAFLRAYLGDDSARVKMTYRQRADRKTGLTAEEVAQKIARYLAEIGPQPAQDATTDAADG